MNNKPQVDQPVTVADFEVVAVQPGPSGFSLTGQGRDGSTYQLDLRLDVPMNRKTQVVLGEMLAQSECRVSRIVRPGSLKATAKRIRRGTGPAVGR